MDRAGDLLRLVFDGLDSKALHTYSSLFSTWEKTVGVDLASHSRLVDVKRGALVVEVDHPGWMQLLQLRQALVLDRLSRRFPELELKGMHFRLVRGLGLEQPVPPAAAATTAEPADSPDVPPRGAKGLNDISDSRLKDALKRLRDDLERRG